SALAEAEACDRNLLLTRTADGRLPRCLTTQVLRDGGIAPLKRRHRLALQAKRGRPPVNRREFGGRAHLGLHLEAIAVHLLTGKVHRTALLERLRARARRNLVPCREVAGSV